MKRLLLVVIAVCALCGCQNRTPPATDPFFGRTRVPPPATGSIGNVPAAPYFNSTPQGVVPAAPSGTATPRAAPGGNQLYAPPGGSFQYRGAPPAGSAATSFSRPGTRVPPPGFVSRSSEGQAPAATRQPVIRTVYPQPGTKTDSSSQRAGSSTSALNRGTAEPRRFSHPDRVIDIMDLPRAGTSNGSARATASPKRFAPRMEYGYDPDYRWLQGKLEYSQIDRRWKLRYIPIDGQTDEFGGSVVLPDAKVLAGCERGEFVRIRGKLGQPHPKEGFAPSYEVAEIERLQRGQP